MKRAFIILALALLIAGCPAIIEEGYEEGTVPAPPPDYSYDLIAKDIHVAPDYPQLTEEYKMRVIVQRYGAYSPDGYSVWILDGNQTLLKKDIFDPEFVESFEFDYYAGTVEPHHIRVEVESLDFMHPEPEANLENNVLRKDVSAYPFGYYDIYNWKITWFYDAVGMQVYQAQAFTLEKPLNISRIGVYVQANVPPPPNSSLKVSLHEQPHKLGKYWCGRANSGRRN